MERIGDEVERTLARGGSRAALPLARLTAAWPEAVGSTIARNAWPRRIADDGTLHVATSSATWASELTLLADELLGRLRQRLGADAPEKLRCAVGPIPEAATPKDSETPVPPSPQASPEVRKTAASVASAIEDPELRDLVARAARASLSKAPSDRHF
jgi:hypothetical protein